MAWKAFTGSLASLRGGLAVVCGLSYSGAAACWTGGSTTLTELCIFLFLSTSAIN